MYSPQHRSPSATMVGWRGTNPSEEEFEGGRQHGIREREEPRQREGVG